MATTQFIERIVSRIDRIDRKELEDCIRQIVGETKFLTALLDQISEGVMVLSPKKEILYVNRPMIRLFNIPEESYQKGTVDQVISDAPFTRLLEGAIDQKREIFDKEFEVLLPRPMVLRLNLFFWRNEKSTTTVVTITNLTHAEAGLRERFKQENWESMLGLAAGIAHEIGNPLNSLMIHLKLLAKTLAKVPAGERKKIEGSLEAMEDETARLDQIVRNFLKATRRKPLRFELTQINDLLSKTVSFLSPELKQAKIRVHENLEKGIPPFLLDPDRLQQVFLNIIKNAIHAMPQGGVLKLETAMKDKLCLIRFQDSGVGIPSHQIPKIFDAYYTTKEEGSGLGLMIVNQIIREHGGRIEVVSKPNFGTSFTIVLPIRKEKLGLPEPMQKEVR